MRSICRGLLILAALGHGLLAGEPAARDPYYQPQLSPQLQELQAFLTATHWQCQLTQAAALRDSPEAQHQRVQMTFTDKEDFYFFYDPRRHVRGYYRLAQWRAGGPRLNLTFQAFSPDPVRPPQWPEAREFVVTRLHNNAVDIGPYHCERP